MGGSGSESPMNLQLRCQLELQSSEGLTGAEGSAFKAAHSHAWQVSDDWWQEDSVPCHVDLSIGLRKYLHDNGSWLPPELVT